MTRVLDKRRIRLNDYDEGEIIPFLSGRPVREGPITTDDEVNLAIAFHTANTLEEFLEMV